MAQNNSCTMFPQLSFLPPEQYGLGMSVSEIKLDPLGHPLAPFNASRFTVEPGCASPVDSHAVHEIWMVAEGSGELIYSDHSIRLKAADVFYFEPPNPHQVKNDGSQALVIFSVWWKG
jgi:quercetin dioxygenase-like cupin family protein